MKKQIIIKIEEETKRTNRKNFYTKSSVKINRKKIENRIGLGINTSKNKRY